MLKIAPKTDVEESIKHKQTETYTDDIVGKSILEQIFKIKLDQNIQALINLFMNNFFGSGFFLASHDPETYILADITSYTNKPLPVGCT